MFRTRMVIACTAGLSILFGAILVVLEITGKITWSGQVPGGAFEVKSTHIGVCFALVGMTIVIFMILKPARYKNVTKTRELHIPAKKEFPEYRVVETESHTNASSSPIRDVDVRR